jgi:hypothetical protein
MTHQMTRPVSPHVFGPNMAEKAIANRNVADVCVSTRAAERGVASFGSSALARTATKQCCDISDPPYRWVEEKML